LREAHRTAADAAVLSVAPGPALPVTGTRCHPFLPHLPGRRRGL